MEAASAQGGPGRVLGRLRREGWRGEDLRGGGRGAALLRAAGGARGLLARTGRRRSDPGEIPPARSQPAAGARPGHCGPRRRSALAGCRERAVPAPSGRSRAPHPRFTRCPGRLFPSSRRAVFPGLFFAVGSVYCTRGGMVTPGQTSAPADPSGAAAGRLAALPARLEGPREREDCCRAPWSPFR